MRMNFNRRFIHLVVKKKRKSLNNQERHLADAGVMIGSGRERWLSVRLWDQLRDDRPMNDSTQSTAMAVGKKSEYWMMDSFFPIIAVAVWGLRPALIPYTPSSGKSSHKHYFFLDLFLSTSNLRPSFRQHQFHSFNAFVSSGIKE